MAAVSAADVSGNTVTAYTERPLVVDVSPPAMAGQWVADGVVAVAGAWVPGVRDGLTPAHDRDCQPRAGLEWQPWDEVQTVDLRNVHSVNSTSTLNTTVVAVDSGALASGSAAYTVLGLNWDPFVDAESGVATVEAALGSAPGKTDVATWTVATVKAGRMQFILPTLPEALVVYGSVRGTNGVGLVGQSYSDGLRLLCEPGTVDCDFDGGFVCLGAHW